MSIYNITILITSPFPEENKQFPIEVEAVDLVEATEKSFDTFKQACKYVWGMPMEMLVKMEPRPNNVMSLTCSCDGNHVDDADVWQRYYSIRIRELQDRMKGFCVEYHR